MNAVSKIKYPIALEWPISEHRLRELMDEPDKDLRSDIFNACESPNIAYYASVELDADKHEGHGEIGVFLSFSIPETTKVEAEFNIKIESAKFYGEVNDVYDEDDDGYGVTICTTDELFDPKERFIVNGKLRIKIDGFLIIEKEEENVEAWKCEKLDDKLGIGLWEQENSKDFTLIAGKKKIIAHKSVLAARSPVFAQMFESGMEEAQENKVVINDFPFRVVEAAVKLCYHHSLVTGISLKEKMKLLQFFDKYDMSHHKENLENYLITVINELTACRLVNVSLKANAVKLETECYEFLQDCLHERKPINDFDLLDKDFAMNLLKNAFYHSSE